MRPECGRFTETCTRRDLLRTSAAGFASVVLAALATQRAAAESPHVSGSLGAGMPHFPPRAKRIIFLFMWGGPSHVDLFDPKPTLNALEGKPLPGSAVGVDRKSLGTIL
ncbi:MAG TPA: DUF1501 domain-containing protein, partial [Planctomycetota bacterium]|nr:DUF1501 domain-containing protein [Planctomycetota bacterium]